MNRTVLILTAVSSLLLGCAKGEGEEKAMTFKDDLDFLKKHVEVVVLKDASARAQLAVVPAWQGRAVTSTAEGEDGASFGWINRELIASGEVREHINVYGGEDRFWLGPEGGQFSIFFEKDAPFDLKHWNTPPSIDTEAYDVVSTGDDRVSFTKDIHLTNYSGTELRLKVDREVKLMTVAEFCAAAGLAAPQGVGGVAFASVNTIRNTGQSDWTKEAGLLSVWILGMFNPSPQTTVVVPFVEGPEDDLGPIVNDAYFGKVPADRLKVGSGAIFFSADGAYRSKIGLSPRRSKPVCGSWDAGSKVLTLVHYTKPEGATDYVNSMWELQDEPFAGDVVNSYNDGPPEPGAKPLGPFYELETSSPAAALAPGETLTHTHATIHLMGDEAALNQVAQAALSVSLHEIESAF